jgi:hypothetical protein
VENPAGGNRTAILVTLAFIVLIGLGLRVGYAVEQPYAQPPDAGAYDRIAVNLAEDGTFEARRDGSTVEVQPASAYAPGLPLFVAAVYWLSGGPHLTLVLILLALIGSAAIPLSYLVGKRLAGPLAGLLGAGLLAIYPALLEYQALLLTEPLAATLLIASLLAFLRAADRVGVPGQLRWFDWVLCGVLLGLLALVRPEYLTIAILLPLLGLGRGALSGDLKPAITAAGVALLSTVLVLAPWTIHNALALDRFVPVSTGGGKTLFIGTNIEAGGDGPALRELLLSERPALRARLARGGPVEDPQRLVLERVLAQVAAERYPGMEVDAALGRLGKEQLREGLTEQPLQFMQMLIEKGYETWTDTPRSVMEQKPWRALQLGILIFALLGLVVLARRKRFEAVVCGLILLYMTAVGALLIASPRRELVVLPLLAALAGVGATACRDSLARRWTS